MAIALWIYVDTVTSPEVTLKVKNVPVEFSGEDTTLADRGLMLLSGYDTTVDLVIKGPRNELRKLDRSKIRIVANTSNIKEAGSQTLTYEVVFPDNIRQRETDGGFRQHLQHHRYRGRVGQQGSTHSVRNCGQRG